LLFWLLFWGVIINVGKCEIVMVMMMMLVLDGSICERAAATH